MSNAAKQSDHMSEEQEAGNQYLTFILAGEEYGVDILKVQEIRSWESATKIPNTPDYVLGVINLRGTIVPIIDVRQRFSMEKTEIDSTTVVVVVKVSHENTARTIGMLVDAVSEVYNVPEADIRPMPDVSSHIATEFVKGLTTVNDKMIIILDVDLLINTGVLKEVLSETE